MNVIKLLAILLLFSFCDSDQKVPSKYLDQRKMAAILTDVHLAEGVMKANYILGDSAKEVAPHFYASIYKKHGVKEELVLESLDYYSGQPAKFKLVYDQVLENLSKIESNLEDKKEQGIPILKEDVSINKLLERDKSDSVYYP